MGQNNQFDVQKWNFDQKKSNLEHESISWNVHVGSWRNLFQSKWDIFHEFWMKMWDAIHSLLVGLMGVWREKKILSLEKVCFELRKKVEVSENFSFQTWKIFLTWKTWMEWKACNLDAISYFLTNN